MQKVSDSFSDIMKELEKLRELVQGQANMVRLLEYELEQERGQRKRLQALITQTRDHAMLIAEECERGEPIVPQAAGNLRLIAPDVRDELSLKLAAVHTEALAVSHPSRPEQAVTRQLPTTNEVKNVLADSFVL